MVLKDAAPLASVGHMPRNQVLSSVTSAWSKMVSQSRTRLCPLSRIFDSTYTKILSKSASNGEVFLGSKGPERCVRIVAGKGAVRTGGIAMLVDVSTVFHYGPGVHIPRD